MDHMEEETLPASEESKITEEELELISDVIENKPIPDEKKKEVIEQVVEIIEKSPEMSKASEEVIDPLNDELK